MTIDLGPLEFRRADFSCKCPGDGKGKPADHYDWCEAQEAADDANHLLRERLGKAPVLYHHPAVPDVLPFWYEHPLGYEDRTGRIVAIEHIPRIAAAAKEVPQ